MNKIFNITPTINGCETAEPNLWDIVYCYYAPHFSRSEAMRLTDEYVSEIEKHL